MREGKECSYVMSSKVGKDWQDQRPFHLGFGGGTCYDSWYGSAGWAEAAETAWKAKGGEMRTKRFLFPLLLSVFFALGMLQTPQAGPPAKGGTLPTFSLEVPKDPIEKAYLGLEGEGSFKVPQVEADVVVVEIFSLYCPSCQAIAPAVKEFYTLIEKDPTLRGKIKIIGIGAGNTPFEVKLFRKTFETPFPLFADKDFVIHKALGEVRTPYFIAIKKKEGGKHEVILSELAAFKGPTSFLETIRALGGLP